MQNSDRRMNVLFLTISAEFDPCPESLVCHNDGYKSIIKGKCQCRCPPGFESSTNCTTFGYSGMLIALVKEPFVLQFPLTLSQKKLLFLVVCGNNSFENTEGKGEIARNEQFLLFPQFFLPFLRTLFYFHRI